MLNLFLHRRVRRGTQSNPFSSLRSLRPRRFILFLLAITIDILYPQFMDIQNPHDKFFKEVFSDKETAADFLKHVVPEEIVKSLDFAMLAPDKTSYIDEELKEYYSDVVYRCKYKSNVFIQIILLFEHKSYVPDYPHLQLFKYLLKIWETTLKQEKKLVPVLPLIFYHGTDKWEVRPFCEYFAGIDEPLKKFIPELNYLLTDLSCYTNEQLKNGVFDNVSTKLSALLMKNIRNEGKLLKNLVDFLQIAALYFREEKGLRFLEAVIRYLMSNMDTEAADIIKKSVEAISFEGAKTVMTIAESLIEKGIEQGIEKGIEKGKIEEKIEAAKNMKNDGLDFSLISKYTGLSIEEIDKL